MHLFMVYMPESKHQLRTMIRDIAHFKSGLWFYYSQRAVQQSTT